MNIQILLLAFIFQSSAFAEIIVNEVHSIEAGIIKFKNGRVAFLNPKRILHLTPGDTIEATIDETSELKSLKKIMHSSKQISKKSRSRPEETAVFEPTIVPNMDTAVEIFNRSNSNYKRLSECTDRAHIWAHNEYKRSNTKSMKAYVFFTASYINSVRFKWWFHVAPMYLVNVNGTIQSVVMDFRYSDRPMSIKTWTDQFVYTKRECKLTTRFSEYDVNPQTENCYLIFESMHYKVPQELSNQETLGVYKTSTSEAELKFALNTAFEH